MSDALHTTREAWLVAGARELEQDFWAHDYTVPKKLRFAIGFPSTGRNGRRIGECWSDTASTDGTFEIYIRPDLHHPVDVLAVLAHEIVHAVVGLDKKHGRVFKRCATAIGLTGKMTATVPSPQLLERLKQLGEKLGPLPHAALRFGGVKRQSTRLLKVECEECGYTCRVTAKWIEGVGPPWCPMHGEMICV